jgi:hypothetical protein
MLKCTQPGCGRAGDDIGDCGSGGVIPCPTPVEVDPARDIVISCKACKMTRVVSIPDQLLKRGSSTPTCLGSTDRCRAVVVPQAKAKAAG